MFFLLRLIFENSPLSIDGVCVATNIAGVDRKYFKIKLLSLDKAQELLEPDNDGNGTAVAKDDLTEEDIHELRQLRHSYYQQEKKRVREQLKVNLHITKLQC